MQLDTTKPGQHTIDCVATDQACNIATSTITRTIMVAAPATDNPHQPNSPQQTADEPLNRALRTPLPFQNP